MRHAHCRRRCLEVGCGSGYVVCSLALLLRELGVAAQLLATDINPQAAAATQATLAAHEVGRGGGGTGATGCGSRLGAPLERRQRPPSGTKSGCGAA